MWEPTKRDADVSQQDRLVKVEWDILDQTGCYDDHPEGNQAFLWKMVLSPGSKSWRNLPQKSEAIVIFIDFCAGTLVTFVSHPSLIHWWQETRVCLIVPENGWKRIRYTMFSPFSRSPFWGRAPAPLFWEVFFFSFSFQISCNVTQDELKLVLHLLRGGDHVFFWNIFLASLLPTKKHVIETCQQQVGMPSPGLDMALKTQPSRCTLNKSWRPCVATWSRWPCAYVTLAAVKLPWFFLGGSSASKNGW